MTLPTLPGDDDGLGNLVLSALGWSRLPNIDVRRFPYDLANRRDICMYIYIMYRMQIDESVISQSF